MSQKFSAPQPLSAEHRGDGFACGESSLDEWLRRRALPNQTTGASRTFVVTDESNQVAGYYAMAAGAVTHQEASGRIRRNMPDPVPVMVLARLAVDQRYQGRKLGAAMLQDAVRRTYAVAQNTGVRALLVHALNESSRQFYMNYGFEPSPVNPMTMMLLLHARSFH
jgi:GNAT superfamily N-acetyltransferase